MTLEEPAEHFLTVAECGIYRPAPVQRDPVALGVGVVPGMGAVDGGVFYHRMGGNQEGR